MTRAALRSPERRPAGARGERRRRDERAAGEHRREEQAGAELEPRLDGGLEAELEPVGGAAWPRYLAGMDGARPASRDGEEAELSGVVDAGLDAPSPALESAGTPGGAERLVPRPTRADAESALHDTPADALRRDAALAEQARRHPPRARDLSDAQARFAASRAAVAAHPVATPDTAAGRPLPDPTSVVTAQQAGSTGTAEAMAAETPQDTAPPEADAADAATDAASPDAASGDAASEADPAAQPEAAAPGSAAAPAAAGGASTPTGPGEEEQAADATSLPPALLEQADEPLEAPPLAWDAVQPEWTASPGLPIEALLPPAPATGTAAAPPPPAKASGTSPTPAAPSPAEPGADARDKRRSEREAATQAQRAWSDLARDTQREQETFVSNANRITHYMAQAYGVAAGDVVQAHDRDRDAAQQAGDRAAADVESAGAFAQMALESSSNATKRAIAAAGRSAYGLISAGHRSGARQIDTVVAGLVAGHIGAYNGAIRNAQTAFDLAIAELNDWRDSRDTEYSTSEGGWLEQAKNEKRQLRIPGWVEPEATNLDTRFNQKKTAWETSRDSTSCSMSCSYRAALGAENDRMAQQGRDAVAGALDRARRTLRQQTAAGRRTLAELTQSHVQQVRTQQRATQSRLNSRARSTLGGLRQESQGAVGGVQGAARSALPTYVRGVQGFEQSLRDTAPRGAQALRQTAERGPEGVRQSTRRSGTQLDARLQGNQQRLEGSLAGRRDEHVRDSTTEAEQLQAQLTEQGTQSRAQLDASSAGFVEAFDGLASTVSDSAASWAQPLETRMAGVIAQKQGEASAALQSLLTGGEAGGGGGGGGGGAGGGGGDGGGAPAADCSSCASASGGGGGGAGGGAAGGAASAGGLDQQVLDEVAHYDQRAQPATFFSTQLQQAGQTVQSGLEGRANNVTGGMGGGFAGSVDEAAVVGALRGMTLNQGQALDSHVYARRHGGRTLDTDLRAKLGADSTHYQAASAYLVGDNETGARLELEDSTGVFNDDEARIEAVMRALSPEQLAALGRDNAGVMADVRDALGGTDREVFDALARGDYAAADAYRMRDAVNDARREGDADATHTAIERYTGAPAEGDWRASQEMDADQRRQEVVRALGGIVSDADVARGVEAGTDVSALSAEDRAVAYVTRDIEVEVGGGGPEGGSHTVTRRITGANRDLAGALLRHGESSVEARAARLGVEIQRRGDPPNAINIDRATFDPRFQADLSHATPAEREAHRRAAEERARVVMLAAERYAGGEATPRDHQPAVNPDDPNAAMNETRVTGARDRLIASLGERFGSDSTGAALAAGLLTDARPSPNTAALAMQHAMSGAGTNEDLLFRFTERMDRDEIAAMRTAYRRNTGRSMDADLGVFGEGFLGEVSGDDRLRMERALLGQPRNDRERLEVAAFALDQQRRESSSFGAWLADGTLANEAMRSTEAELSVLAGGPIAVSARGEIINSLPNFDREGRYTGADRDTFAATTGAAQQIAETYARRIDAFADVATTGIAILGAIAAAVITVATGGAAAPLIAAAIVTGLASMSANYAIKGGRYGWEQAAVDLGMTAVQAVTAGVGAQLGAAAQVASKGAAAASTASRSLVSLARVFTGNPVVDQIIIGAITGSIGGLSGAAFDERTWAHGADDAVGALFAGLIRGGLSGAATAALTNSVEALARQGASVRDAALKAATRPGVGSRILGGIDDALNAGVGGGRGASASAMATRGLARGTVSGLGGMAGRGTEIAFDASTGRYKGDAGDALLDIGRAGAQAFVQGIGEGAGEAVGQGRRTRHVEAAEAEINRERTERRLPELEGPALRAAADDLMFLNQHGRAGGDGLGRAINLDHIATHGGLQATVATVHPEPVVVDGMRAELMRHVPPDQHTDFADVPIRVLPAAEYHALTRSESGPVVTLIEGGRPVVVVREGTSLVRLADEGPHLVQSRDAHTRDRVARLDEATLARWDSLDLDTQVDLYRNKIELEIDAHQRIHESLQGELARARDGGHDSEMARIAAELERNAGTLQNLRARHEEVAAIGPTQRAAIEAGEQPRPQYLDQPARLFSKDGPQGRARSDEQSFHDDVLETMLTEIAEKRRMSARDGLVDEDLQNLPEAVVSFLRRGEHMPGRGEVPAAVKNWARRVARERFGRQLQAALLDGQHNTMTRAAMEHLSDAQLAHVMRHGELPHGVEFHHLLPVADFPEFAHLAEAGTALPHDVHQQAGHAMDYTAPVEAATLRDPDALTRPGGLHNDPEARKFNRPTAREVAEGSRSTGDVDADLVKDFRQRVRAAEGEQRRAEQAAQRWPTPANQARVEAARADVTRARLELEQVKTSIAVHAEMRGELMRHVPPELRAQFADVPIRILPEAEYRAFTRSDAGPVVTIFRDGQPMVIVREGTPTARLADEGPHLVQSHELGTASRVARLDETELAHWDSLDLDTQLDLYRNKIELEIDAHERIVRSVQADTPDTPAAQARAAADLARAQGTLRNLRGRLAEVDALGPTQRAAIADGTQTRPQYLDQPPRLFSKDSPGGSARPAGYEGQPELRGPRIVSNDPESREALRQRHEDWVEGIRRGYLDVGSRPAMTEGDVPAPGRPPWHESIEAAYANYDALVRQHGGTREVGIVRNADTGEYMVVLGSPTALRIPMEALRQETVLHYHPDYGPSLYRGPSGTDLNNTAGIALMTGRPATEFIEYGPADKRGRTAFTLTPVPDPSVPGGRRLQIDIEFIHPTTGEYVHQRFANRQEWSDYYHARTAAFDPDGPVYRSILRAWGMSDAQIDAAAARHRPEGAPEPARPEPAPRGRPTQAVVGDDAPATASIADAGRRIVEHQRDLATLDLRLEGNRRTQATLETELGMLRAAADASTADRQTQVKKRLASLRAAETELLARRATLDADIDAQVRLLLPELARQLDLDLPALAEAIARFASPQGRRGDAKHLIESLRNRIRKHPPYGNLEGLVAETALEQNAIAVEAMREHIRATQPHAVLSVERGGAFLAEVLAGGGGDFPPSVAVPKHVTPRPGQEDLVQRTPHLEAEIRRRIAQGETDFAIVDFYMGGHFAEELETMFLKLRADFPELPLKFDAMWLRETHGYETLAARRPTLAQLKEGVSFEGTMSIDANGRVRLHPTSQPVTLPSVKGNADNVDFIRITHFPVSVVLGDDMRTVFDPNSRQPIRVFDRHGRIVREIPVGTRDPLSAERLRNTREIVIRLMQGHRFDKKGSE